MKKNKKRLLAYWNIRNDDINIFNKLNYDLLTKDADKNKIIKIENGARLLTDKWKDKKGKESKADIFINNRKKIIKINFIFGDKTKLCMLWDQPTKEKTNIKYKIIIWKKTNTVFYNHKIQEFKNKHNALMEFVNLVESKNKKITNVVLFKEVITPDKTIQKTTICEASY